MTGALAARGITYEPGELYSDVEGDIRNLDGVMVITDIRVKYHLKVPADKREAAERALGVHERRCPAAQSVTRGINVEWEADIEEV
ncbi:MAG: OsmC family protein [Anaerolineae bacterium]